MSESHEISDCEVSLKLVNKFQFQLKWHSDGQIFYVNTYTHYLAHVCVIYQKFQKQWNTFKTFTPLD